MFSKNNYKATINLGAKESIIKEKFRRFDRNDIYLITHCPFPRFRISKKVGGHGPPAPPSLWRGPCKSDVKKTVREVTKQF